MQDSNETDENGVELPKKLRTLIEETDVEPRDEAIIEAGELKLASTQPVRVVEYFLDTKRSNMADWTFRDYSYDLTRFLEYCAENDITDLSKLSKRHMEGFRHWRDRDDNICLVTLHAQLANIRIFIRFCEKIEIVEEGIADNIELPDLDPSDMVSYVRLRTEEAESILEYHEHIDTATRAHAEFVVIWELLLRLGDVRSLDLDNYCEDEDGQRYIELTHDPDEDTPLKNQESEVEGEGGERKINVPDWVSDILDDYIENRRCEVEDDYGRKPLFSTSNGRISESTLRRDLYKITQPCEYGRGCPYDRDSSECTAKDYDFLSQCPSSVSPHPVRRGGICHQLKKGVPKDTICERADVSRKVLNLHYDLRTKEEARQQRRQELKKHLDGYNVETDDIPAGEMTDTTQNATEPLAAAISNLGHAKNQVITSFEPETCAAPSTRRAATGIAGYCIYLALVAFNFGLVGIGFNPVTGEIIVNI